MRQGIRATVLAGVATLAMAAPAMAAPPPNDDLAVATPFTANPQTLPYTTVDSTVQPGEVGAALDGVWFQYAVAVADTFRVQTLGSTGDPSVQVYKGPPGATFADLGPLAMSDDDSGPGFDADTGFAIPAVPGEVLYVRVRSFTIPSAQANQGSGGVRISSASIAPVGPAVPDPVNCTATATGTGGPDVFGGTPAADAYNGLGGNDRITGNANTDCLLGGGDNDTMGGGYDDDEMSGNAGQDIVQGGYHDDILSGGSGPDTVDGEYDNDYVFGGPGADTLKGGYGDDVLDARDGAGNDTLNCGYGNDSVLVDPGDSVASNCETIL